MPWQRAPITDVVPVGRDILERVKELLEERDDWHNPDADSGAFVVYHQIDLALHPEQAGLAIGQTNTVGHLDGSETTVTRLADNPDGSMHIALSRR